MFDESACDTVTDPQSSSRGTTGGGLRSGEIVARISRTQHFTSPEHHCQPFDDDHRESHTTNASRTTIIGSSVFLDSYRLAFAERIACLHDAHMRRFVSPIAAGIIKLGVDYCHPRYHPLS